MPSSFLFIGVKAALRDISNMEFCLHMEIFVCLGYNTIFGKKIEISIVINVKLTFVLANDGSLVP